jgi:tetratricopeptide (TPR) repeat protein
MALAMGRNDEAQEVADRILALNPGQADARFVKGLAQLGQRQFDEAGKQAEAILAAAPRDERGLVLKARVMFAKGQADEAIAQLEARSDPATRSDLLSRTLLELYRATGRAEPALAQLARIIERNPDDLDSTLDRTMILYKTGETAQARAQARRLLARKSVPPEALGRLAQLWQAYDPDPLGAPGSTAIGDADAALAIARFYLLQGQHDRALAWLGAVRTPAAEALRWRIVMSRKPGAEGARAIGAILARDETQCDALLARAHHARSVGHFDAAIRDAQQAVNECPEDPGGVLDLAQAYRAKGDLTGEFRAYDKGLSNDPQSLPVSRAYFDRSLEAKDAERARAVARRLTGAAPSLAAGWVMLAQACSVARDPACLDTAKAGLAEARTSLATDLRPGEIDRRGIASRL